MKRTHARLHAIALLASLILLATPLRADIAPPEQPPGSTIQPTQATQVQMLAERVVIEVLRVKGAHDTSLPVANVIASFTMRNSGSAAETMTVRFPLSDPSGQGDGMGGHPEIEQVTITVNDKRVPTRIVTTANPRGESEPPIRWAAFDVTFPPGRDVVINVEYILQSTGYMPYGRFKYILETGAGWFGRIGLATIVLRLPYEATPENIVLGTPGGQFSGREVRWTFRDLEPTEQDNFYVTVLAPSVWERILQARRRAVAAPKSAAAWRELAQAYLGAVFGKYGPEIGANFVPLIEEAYRRAQENDPDSAQLHAEWAQTLLDLYPPTLELDPVILEKILAALQAAFERDPNDAIARKVAAELRDWLVQRTNFADAGSETAKKTLETLDQMIQTAGMARSADVTPTPAATAAEALPPASVPMTSSSFVTSVTATGVVVTSTVISTITTTLTDTTTAQPVVIVTVQESRTVTETTDLAGTIPATVTEVIVTSIVTTTPGEAATTTGTVITTTNVTTNTKILEQVGADSPETITSVSSVTETTTATPLSAASDALAEATPTTVVATVETPAPPTATGAAIPTVDGTTMPPPTPPEAASPDNTAWGALLLTLIIGGAAAYGIHKLTIRRDRARAAPDAERPEDQPESSPTDRSSADL